MKAYLINMHLLVPRSRSSAKVKVKYKGYISQKMAVSVAFVFHKHILFFIILSFQSLMSAFHCRDPLERQKKLFPITLTMRTYEVYFDLPDDEGADGEEGKPENVIKVCNVNPFPNNTF